MQPEHWIFVFVLGLLMLGMAFMAAFMLMLFQPWLQSFMAGAPVSIFDIIGMRLRGSPPRLIVETRLVLKYRGIAVSITDVERVYLANKGQVDNPSRLAAMVEEKMRRQAESAKPATSA